MSLAYHPSCDNQNLLMSPAWGGGQNCPQVRITELGGTKKTKLASGMKDDYFTFYRHTKKFRRIQFYTNKYNNLDEADVLYTNYQTRHKSK